MNTDALTKPISRVALLLAICFHCPMIWSQPDMSLDALEVRAQSGDAEAAMELANEYIYCRNIPRTKADQDLRLKELEDVMDPAYEQGLREIFSRCHGISDSQIKSIPDLLYGASDSGNVEAMLAYYRYGRPDSRFYSNEELKSRMELFELNSFQFLQDAINHSPEEALFLLGYAYLEGRGVNPDPEAAYAYFRAFELCSGEKASDGMELLREHFSYDNPSRSAESESERLAESRCNFSGEGSHD